MRAITLLSWLLSCAVVTGCRSNGGPPIEPVPGSEKDLFDDDGYPTEGLGTEIGDVIESFGFEGYVDPSASHEVVSIALGHFYNPTGTGSYGADDPFPDGEPRPKALVINVGALWCGPCKNEAKELLPVEYAALGPRGMELLLVLADSGTVGEPADLDNLDSWTSAFEVDYPAVIDPARQLGALFAQSQYPANFLIDPRTMSIVDLVAGVPSDSFWAKVEELLVE